MEGQLSRVRVDQGPRGKGVLQAVLAMQAPGRYKQGECTMGMQAGSFTEPPGKHKQRELPISIEVAVACAHHHGVMLVDNCIIQLYYVHIEVCMHGKLDGAPDDVAQQPPLNHSKAKACKTGTVLLLLQL